jgi:antirestriction protein ArdC
MTMNATREKVDVYQVITDRITQQLEKGVIPWRKPWKNLGAPANLISKKAYRGINTFILMAGGYTSKWWLSFKQVKDLGGRVKAGEKGWPVVFWRRLTKEDVNSAGEKVDKSFMMLRYYTVFNVDQTTGLEGKVPQPEVLRTVEPIDACEALVKGMPLAPEIKIGGNRACYSLSNDYVGMPAQVQFESDEMYYQTLFHELIHSTGAEKRLGRFKGDVTQAHFGSESYSQEELVAEMGAAFLCGVAGIEGDLQNSSAYIDNWLSALKGDRKLIVMAAAQAQKAADYIQNIKWDDNKKDEDEGE